MIKIDALRSPREGTARKKMVFDRQIFLERATVVEELARKRVLQELIVEADPPHGESCRGIGP
jgi:hypothetical protein